MKNLFKTLIIALFISPMAANAQISANAGWVSDYFFRGIFQAGSSASAGVDLESGGLYAGTWAADVGDGLEVDLYAGFGTSVGDLGLSAGFTGYYYTGDFDDTYEEINLGLSYGAFALDYADGTWDGFGEPADYAYTSLSYAAENGFGIVYHSHDGGNAYLEPSYNFDLSGIDAFIALVIGLDDSEEGIVFGIGTSW